MGRASSLVESSQTERRLTALYSYEPQLHTAAAGSSEYEVLPLISQHQQTIPLLCYRLKSCLSSVQLICSAIFARDVFVYIGLRLLFLIQ